MLDGSRKDDAVEGTPTQTKDKGRKPKAARTKSSLSRKKNTIPGKTSLVRSQKGKKPKVTGNYTCKEFTVWWVILDGIILCGFMRKSLLFLLAELAIAF